MKKYFLIAMMTVMGMGTISSAVHATEKKSPPQKSALPRAGTSIAAVVNEDAISEIDVRDRLRLVIISAGLPDSPEMRQRAINQVLDTLIDEQIKMQEAARHKLTVSEEDVANALKTIAGNNKMTPEQFEDVMRQQGIQKNTLIRQIKAQIAWTKVVQNVIRDMVSVSQNDVAALKERLKANIGKSEYLTSEIFLPVSEESNDADVRALANRLISEIGEGKASFAAVAAQVSRSAGAEKGGDIGWIQEGGLPKELDEALRGLAEGQISQPIHGTDGYHILQLRKKRTFSEENIPSNDDMTNQIGFDRLDKAQQRYLLNLKSSAFIDRRV
jgi:peptidyl-prolyl cis-trans isomerase SurA